jgi:ferredoxin--NADP+ reductase
VPNVAGRVLRDGVISPGEYVVGWIKRGPTGVIGTNRSDALETVAGLLADLPDGAGATGLDVEHAVGWDGWLAIEGAEAEAGLTHGRGRVKLASWDELRAAATADRSPAGVPDPG